MGFAVPARGLLVTVLGWAPHICHLHTGDTSGPEHPCSVRVLRESVQTPRMGHQPSIPSKTCFQVIWDPSLHLLQSSGLVAAT